MRTPQLENGYTQIANELLDALAKFRIPGEQRQILDFIIRKTYGYKKKEDRISNSQFCEGTGLKKGNVARAVKALIEKKVVIKSDNSVIKSDNKIIPSYRFNKNYSEWVKLSKKQPVIKKATTVIKSDNKTLSKVMDTKEKKETLQKKGFKKPVSGVEIGIETENQKRLREIEHLINKKENASHAEIDKYAAGKGMEWPAFLKWLWQEKGRLTRQIREAQH